MACPRMSAGLLWQVFIHAVPIFMNVAVAANQRRFFTVVQLTNDLPCVLFRLS